MWAASSLLIGADWGPVLPVLSLIVAAVLAVAGIGSAIVGLARTERQVDTASALVTFGLSLLGGNDPWQRNKPWAGRHCGPRMSQTNGSRSMVITEGPYADRHAVLMDPDVRAAVAAFIETNMKK